MLTSKKRRRYLRVVVILTVVAMTLALISLAIGPY